MFARMKSVSDGMILSGTGEAKLQCSGGPNNPIVTVKFKTAFAKPPAVFVNLNGIHNCQNGGASFRADIQVAEVTTTFVKIKASTWADTKMYSFWFSWMAIGPELTADVANLKARRTQSGDDKRGRILLL
jgi:hypothetical protein